MFNWLGRIIARHWLLVILAWIVAAVVLHAVAPRWEQVTRDGDLAFLPPNMPSIQGEELLHKAFPKNRAKSQLAVVVERPGGALTSEDFLWTDAVEQKFTEREESLRVVGVWSHNTKIVGDKLKSRATAAGQATIILLQVSNEFMAVDNMRLLGEATAVVDEARRDPHKPAGLRIGVTGSAAIGGDMLASAAESIRNTEWATIILVIAILLVVYRAPLLVIIPVVTIGISFLVSTDILALLTQVGNLPGLSWWNFKVFTTTKIFIVVILFGSGTDFCLFLIARFREELEGGQQRVAAVQHSIGQVGHALVGSAFTTILGLSTMVFADFGKFRNGGPAIAISLFVTLIACITLAPAVLRACGSWVFWPFGKRLRVAAVQIPRRVEARKTPLINRFWDAASRFIMAHPGAILVASVLALAPIAYEGAGVKITYDLLNELQPDRPSVVGAEMAKRHFAAGEMSPITVLALQEGGKFNTPEGDRKIAQLTKLLYDTPGVERVRSLSEPLGDKPGYFQPFSRQGLKKLAARKHRLTQETFVPQVTGLEGDLARFDLVLKHEPFSPQAVAVIEQAEKELDELGTDPDSPWYRAQFRMVGTTVGIRDLEVVTQSDQRLIQQLVLLAVLGVLIVILRKPLVCVYLILSVLFSYYVTMGATRWFFSWQYGATFYGLDWKVPIFLFVILIAVGEDYNIFLVTRVLEEQERHGLFEGLRLAIARTGGIITSCGVIMAGTFISMMFGTLRGMQELGFSLSLGVMLDTCVVRPVLVPAFMALAQRFFGARVPSPSREPAATAGRR